MSAFIKIQRIIGMTLSLFIWSYAQASDVEQSYAIKGAGAVSCERYVTALKEKSEEYIAFSGWIDGYITSVNQFKPETFDMVPWQSTLLLTQALGRYCEKNIEARFFNALTLMLRTLGEKRLKKRSEIVKIRSNNKTLLIYKDVIKLMQAQLNKNNSANIKVDGIYSKDTEAELRRFQKQNKIAVTGIPNQLTLQMLFR